MSLHSTHVKVHSIVKLAAIVEFVGVDGTDDSSCDDSSCDDGSCGDRGT